MLTSDVTRSRLWKKKYTFYDGWSLVLLRAFI